MAIAWIDKQQPEGYAEAVRLRLGVLAAVILLAGAASASQALAGPATPSKLIICAYDVCISDRHVVVLEAGIDRRVCRRLPRDSAADAVRLVRRENRHNVRGGGRELRKLVPRRCRSSYGGY